MEHSDNQHPTVVHNDIPCSLSANVLVDGKEALVALHQLSPTWCATVTGCVALYVSSSLVDNAQNLVAHSHGSNEWSCVCPLLVETGFVLVSTTDFPQLCREGGLLLCPHPFLHQQSWCLCLQLQYLSNQDHHHVAPIPFLMD